MGNTKLTKNFKPLAVCTILKKMLDSCAFFNFTFYNLPPPPQWGIRAGGSARMNLFHAPLIYLK